MNQHESIIAAPVISALIRSNARRATKYLTERLTVKASRMHPLDRRECHAVYVVTIGAPNYAEREFIWRAKAAGEPFPVKKIQLKFYPPKKR